MLFSCLCSRICGRDYRLIIRFTAAVSVPVVSGVFSVPVVSTPPPEQEAKLIATRAAHRISDNVFFMLSSVNNVVYI